MKVSNHFKNTIEAYLKERSEMDELFAQSFAKEGKSIDECVNFILNSVKESGCNGFTDEEVYGMAIHYYDEDDLDTKYLKSISSSVVVNHQISLTEEEKKEIEEKAKKDYYNEALRKQRELNSRPKKVVQDDNQLSLF